MKKRITLILLLCLLVVSLVGCECKHEWQEADCVIPKTCTKCGASEGEALGHKWVNATCKEPKHCSVCGEIEGTLMDHSWLDATCEEPKSCRVCSETEGDALGHDWVDATCTAAKTCSRCGTTEGDPLAHMPGETEVKADYVNAVYTVQSVCTVCGEIAEQQDMSMSSLHEDGKFTFNATEFTERFSKYLDEQSSLYSVTLASPPGKDMGVAIKYFDDWIATILLTDKRNFMKSGREDDRDIAVMIVKFESNDSSDLASVLLAMTQTCDPSLSYRDAQDVGTGIILMGQKGKSYEHNGINYLLGEKNGEFEFYVSLLKK